MFDYIIIGAGAAGSVLADRLSADGHARVLVLEAGGSDQRLWVRMPLGYGRTFSDSAVNWKYHTVPQAELNNRSLYWPRGKVVGGSSSINAMVHMRGLRHDYDDWRDSGCHGWGADDVWPVFDALEQRIDPNGKVSGKGPVAVNDLRSHLHPLGKVLKAAAEQLNLPQSDDFNGPSPEGVGPYRFNIRAGRRWSAADAFLKPALRRKNVELVVHAHATRIRIQDGRATGVDYHRYGKAHSVDGGQIILCGGAVNSPQLLQLSGIGPGALLQSHNIPVIRDLPAVGRHLQDHLCVSHTFISKRWTVNDQLNSYLSLALHGLRYFLTRTGPMALSVNQFGGYLRADQTGTEPDTQLYFNPISYGAGAGANKDSALRIDPFSGFILCYQPSRPTSRGRVEIAEPNPFAPPKIDPNYLATEGDQRQVIQGGRLLQRLGSAAAFQQITKRVVEPSLFNLDDQGLLDDFRARAGTVYHPVGTCRMGVDPKDAAVDTQLRVFGIEGLRVVDASVFPTITSANTHAPTLMVAERAAQLILKNTKDR